MSRQYTIYRITNRLNGRFYIGRTINSIEKRWADHKSASKRKNLARLRLYKAMNEDGVDNFYIETIHTVNSFKELKKAEREYIISSRCFVEEIGYNMSIDTDQGLEIMDPETIKMRRIKSYQRTRRREFGFGITKIANRYRGCIVSNKKVYLCSFSVLKEAQIWYDRMAISLYGDIAVLNWPTIKHSEEDIQKAHLEHIHGGRVSTTAKTGYWGVQKDKKYDRFYTEISKDGRQYNLGSYPSKEEAAHAFDIAALILYGVYFNRFNFPDIAITRCQSDHIDWLSSKPSRLRNYKVTESRQNGQYLGV